MTCKCKGKRSCRCYSGDAVEAFAGVSRAIGVGGSQLLDVLRASADSTTVTFEEGPLAARAVDITMNLAGHEIRVGFVLPSVEKTGRKADIEAITRLRDAYHEDATCNALSVVALSNAIDVLLKEEGN